MFTSIFWAPRGVFAEKPDFRPEVAEEDAAILELSSDEDDRLVELEASTAARAEAAAQELELARVRDDPALADIYARYGFADYNNDDRDLSERMLPPTEHASNTADKYLTVNDAEDLEQEQQEMFRLAPATDLMLVAARNVETELQASYVDVFCYDTAEALVAGNAAIAAGRPLPQANEDIFFHHHDIQVPYLVLQTAWIGFNFANPGTPANLVAVAGFNRGIEIYPLDRMDCATPVLTLGGEQPVVTKKNRKTVFRPIPGSHLGDAVLCVDWNAGQPNLLASGGDDTTVRVWNLAAPTAMPMVFTVDVTGHQAPVARVRWIPFAPHALLSAALDGSVALIDVRANKVLARTTMPAPVEDMCVFSLPDGAAAAAVACSNGQLVVIQLAHALEGQLPLSMSAKIVKKGELTAVSAFTDAPGTLCVAGANGVTALVTVDAAGRTTVVSKWEAGEGAFSAAACAGTPLMAVGCANGRIAVSNADLHGTVVGDPALGHLLEVTRIHEPGDDLENDDSDHEQMEE